MGRNLKLTRFSVTTYVISSLNLRIVLQKLIPDSIIIPKFIDHLRQKKYIAFIDNEICPNRSSFDGYPSTPKLLVCIMF